MTSRTDVDEIFGDDEDEGSTRPQASSFVDGQAEAEDDGAASADEEEDEDDDGADLEGFIDPDGEKAGTAGATQAEAGKDAEEQSTDSEDFDEDFDEGDLGDDDLAVLAAAGLDIEAHVPALKAKQAEVVKPAEESAEAKIRPRTDEAEADAEGLESSAKRPRIDTLVTAETTQELEAQLFGEEGETDAAADEGTAAQKRDEVDLFDDDADSMDDFLVEEDQEAAAKRRKKDAAEEAAELDIDEDQLQEIIDIFGNTDVLKPVDEFGLEEEGAAPPVLPTQRSRESQSMTPLPGLPPSTAPFTPAMTPTPPAAGVTPPEFPGVTPPGVTPASPMPSEAGTLGPSTPKPAVVAEPDIAMDGVDPDLKEMMYEMPEDLELERVDAPERWVQTYMSENLLLSMGVRRWTDEEEDAETTWIYMEAFWHTWYDRVESEDLIKKILRELHNKKLEPQYIMANNMWQYANFFYTQDMLRIFELDYRWQKVWVLYRRLQAWISRLREQGQEPPPYIVKKVSSEVWQHKDAEQELTDTWDWLCAMHPDSEEAAQEVKKSHDLQKMAAAIQFQLHEKLGIIECPEGAPLQVFSITPQEFGTNIEQGKSIFKPEQQRDDRAKPEDVCRKCVVPNSLLYSPEAVQDVICLYLSRLIAAEPRVRSYVRARFWEMCAISTRPTRSGKQQAEEASAGFRESYRAFHIVNRPAKSFIPEPGDEKANPTPDMLWLDIVNLLQKGFIELEYSLIQRKDERQSVEDGYRLALLGYDKDAVSKTRQRLLKHFDNLKDPFFDPKDAMEKEGAKYTAIEDIRLKLLRISRAAEVVARMKAVGQTDAEAKKKAEALFKASGVLIKNGDHLFDNMQHDPIYEHLTGLYCYTEFMGERETYIVPTPWNHLRKNIMLRTLRDELYPLFWTEVQAYLSSVVQREVCRQCAEALTKIVDMGPPTLTEEELAAMKHKDDDSDDETEWKREKKAREAGRSTVLSIVPDITFAVSSDSAVVTVVNEYGEAMVQHALFRSFYRFEPDAPPPLEARGILKKMEWEKRKEHWEIFKNILKRYKPALIVIPILDDSANRMRERFEKMLERDKSFKEVFKVRPQVLLTDAAVPRLVAYHQRLKDEGVYRDCANPQQRIAISAARFIQDPFAETAQLWHEKPEHNMLFQLTLHRLQHVVPREMLQRALMEPLTSVLGKVGVDVNRIRRAPHLQSVLPFASGLGPRKARLFKRCINNAVSSKQKLGELIAKLLKRPTWEDALQSPVVVNVLPFCKLCPTGSDGSAGDMSIDGFDQTRLPEYQKPWLSELCYQALKLYAENTQDKELLDEIQGQQRGRGEDDDLFSPVDSPVQSPLSGDDLRSPVSELISDEGYDADGNLVKLTKVAEAKKKTVQKDWILRAVQRNSLAERSDNGETWTTILEREALPADELKSLVNRTFPEASEQDVFRLREYLTPEVQTPFKDNRTAFAKLDPSELFYLMIGETEEKLTNGSLVCATVKEDKEFVLDEDGAPKFSDMKMVKVNVMPWDVTGVFRKTYNEKDDMKSGYIDGCDTKFEEGETVQARVISIKTFMDKPASLNLSVDKDAELWKANFPIKPQDMAFFVPQGSEDWTKFSLGRVGDTEKDKKKRRLKEWVDRPRNIRHPNWYNVPHDSMLQIMMSVPLGTAVFRPSKRFDCLVAMLKVRDTNEEIVEPDKAFRTFDIIERTADGVKTHGNSFELAQELVVDDNLYTDFDDIIARHLDPIMDNLRLFQEHKRFGLSVGMETRKLRVKEVLASFTKKRPSDLHYTFLLHDAYPGHGMMLWALGGRKVREELIEIIPEGFRIWGTPFSKLGTGGLVEWFKSVGWRQSHSMRTAWLKTRKERFEKEKENRGEDAIGQVPTVGFSGYNTSGAGGLMTPSGSGLATPGGTRGYMTPTVYGNESAAPTPSGLRTPMGDGSRTPMQGGSAPATPGAPSTPFHRAGAAPATPRAPATPHHSAGVPGTPRGLGAPGTVQSMAQPGTPAALLGRRPPGTPAGPPPPTPAVAIGTRAAGTPGMHRAAGTPAGPPPATPSPGPYLNYGMPASGTPAGPPPGTPAPVGFRAASGTPAGPPPGTPAPAGYGRAAGTPAGPPPATPSPGVYRSAGPGTPFSSAGSAAGTPAGPPPGTPAPANYRRAAGTPAGPPPATPSPGYVGSAAGTPAGPPPATPGISFGRAAGTPAGPPPGTPLPASYRAAGTPLPASYRPAGTPAGPPPATPLPSSYRAAGTPAGPPPGTPMPARAAAAGTPAGPPPATPSPGVVGRGAPATPGAALPSQGAKREDKDEKKDAFSELFD